MAITYQSIQSNTASSGTTVVVTKPVGLAVGDLMMASSIYTGNNGITLPSGFSTISSGNLNGLRSYITGYKIATAGDVAASNFTFTAGSTIGSMTASLVRYTTTSTFPTNPVIAFQNVPLATGTANPSFSLTGNTGPDTTQLLAFYCVAANVTSSAQASNPTRTWTEINDFNVTGVLGTSLAYAPNTLAEALSSYSLTISTAGNPHVLVFMIIGETSNAIADISHLAVTPAIEGIVPQVNVATDIGHTTITPTIEGISGKASSDQTQWTNTPKPTETEWNNTPK